MKPFPSSLPPQTVLDCILDDNWRDNGILHVLDVISWKGQDLADCETPFRSVSNLMCPSPADGFVLYSQVLVARHPPVRAHLLPAALEHLRLGQHGSY